MDETPTVAWAAYDGGDTSFLGAKCDACQQDVPVTDAHYDMHVKAPPGGSYAEPSASGTNSDSEDDCDDAEDSDSLEMCDGSGTECRYDVIEKRGGKYVLLAKSTGKVLGTHTTRGEAEAQERAVQASKHADARPSRRWERIDFAPGELPRARITPEGFLQVSGRVARTGIQEYCDGVGGIRRELRLPDEVRKSLSSFPLQPMVNNHPSEMVDPNNAQKYVVGAVGAPALNGDGWVTAPLSIWRADAIRDARNGRVQLSVGYTCRLDNSPGEWQGQRYDAIQRDIVVNHVALVDFARAGDDARLRLDARDAIAVARDTGITSNSDSTERQMAKLKIGGLEFDVQDANVQAAVDGALSQKDRDVATERLRADNAEKMLATAQKEISVVQAKLDGKIAEDRQPIYYDGQEIAVVDATDSAKFSAWAQPIIDRRAAERAALLVEARKHLGANIVFDAHTTKDGRPVAAKTDDEIKRLVVGKLKPSIKLDGKDAIYVGALYDDAVSTAAKTPSATDVARSFAGQVPQPQLAGERADVRPARFDPESARQKMIERMTRANPRHPQHVKG